MISNLNDKIMYNIMDKTESVIAEIENISETDAREIVKNMSLADYVRFNEATTQGTLGTIGTQGTAVPNSNQRFNTASANVGDFVAFDGLDGGELGGTIGRKIGNEFEIETDDGQKINVPGDKLKGPGQITDKNLLTRLTLMKTGAQNIWKKGKADAEKNKVTVTASEVQDELHRIQELAGMPSIVGDTAHPPTVRLRAKNRRKREKKGK